MLTSGGEQRKTQDFEEWRSSVTGSGGGGPTQRPEALDDRGLLRKDS
jgi:hypothetical protein